jgi:hypothetical protein
MCEHIEEGLTQVKAVIARVVPDERTPLEAATALRQPKGAPAPAAARGLRRDLGLRERFRVI